MDIHKDGRGIWFVIHTLALNSNKQTFESMMNTLSDHFGCETCKPHIKKFMENHSFRKYQNIFYKNEDIGYFKWSWELHNEVNRRLNKPVMAFDETLMMYKNTVCKNCNNILIPIEAKSGSLPPSFNLISR